ncbi:MAG: carotenoid 1,2-hydratase, partial [Pleurocapsa sp. SU_196_0]|nr:carotenoid 1,2-hydratase [Pleurocapsa sp. SU_196_0]
MKRLLLLGFAALFVACAPSPTRNLEPFVERKPDPILDQAAHRAPVEWWYLNGHLETASGPKSFAAAIFQAFIPDNASYNLAQLFPGAFYFGHYSVLDAANGTFQSSELSSLPRARPDIAVKDASASEERMDVRLGAWRMTRESDGVYTARFDLKGKDRLELRLRPTRPEAIHGPGWSGTKETGRMYYYSATRSRSVARSTGKGLRVSRGWIISGAAGMAMVPRASRRVGIGSRCSWTTGATSWCTACATKKAVSLISSPASS